MRINLPKDFYLLLLSLLPEDIGVRLTNFVSLTRQSDRMYQQKHRKTDRQTDRKNVSLTSPQTAEISSKSPLFGENGSDSVTPRALGGKGGLIDYNDSACNNNDALSNHDAKLKDTLNSINQTKSEKTFSKKTSESKKEKWERISREFSPYWAAYPEEGRIDWSGSRFAFNKLRKDVPSSEFFMGLVIHFRNNVWTDERIKIPAFKTFFEREEWKGLDAGTKAKIEGNLAHCRAVLEKRVKKFNQGAAS